MCWLIPYAITDPDQEHHAAMCGALSVIQERCGKHGELANQNQQVNDGPEK